MKLYTLYSKQNKYRAKRTTSHGYSFASRAEADLYEILLLRLKAGDISHIQYQDHVYLTRARILYIADFKITRNDRSIEHVEYKGFETPVWRIKKRLWKCYGPNKLEIWQSNRQGPFLSETIIPVASVDSSNSSLENDSA